MPHIDGAYNLACYLTRDASLSEDIVQNAFERAFKAFGDFKGGSPRAWLFAIVRNCSFSALSAKNSQRLRLVTDASLAPDERERVSNYPDAAENPEDLLIRRQESIDVRSALESLPEPFREAIILREFEDLSYKEIAEVTGVAIGTVMSRLARGRSMLARVLLEHDEVRGSAIHEAPR